MIFRVSLVLVFDGVIVMLDIAVPSSLSIPYSAKTSAVASSAVVFASVRFFLEFVALLYHLRYKRFYYLTL